MHVQCPSLGYLGHVLFCMGYPNQALLRCNAAIDEARRLAHAPSLAGSLATATRLLSLMGDYSILEERARELVALTTERGWQFWGGMGTISLGWAKVNSGELPLGTSLLCEGSAVYLATGAKAWVPYHLALLARARELAGQIDRALEHVEEAFRIVDMTGERWLIPELIRQKAQLLTRTPNATAAEGLFRTAFSLAIEQKAKLWQLRATASLARLWSEQGRRNEARELLAPVYGWFTEGFDTADLKDAAALLAELA
jgi:predicted ATPase